MPHALALLLLASFAGAAQLSSRASWAPVVLQTAPLLEARALRDPGLADAQRMSAQIVSRLAAGESGLSSLEFLRFLPRRLQASPEAFASLSPAARARSYARGLHAAARGLDAEASDLLAQAAPSAAQQARMGQLADIGFYLRPETLAALEAALGRSPTAMAAAAAMAGEGPAGQARRFDRSRPGADEAGPVRDPGGPRAPRPHSRLLPYKGGRLKTTLTLPSGAAYTTRPARVADAREVMELIHDAFEVWKEKGLRLSPMTQTLEQTKKHLKGKGVVAEDADGRITGTFSLDDGGVSRLPGGGVRFDEGGQLIDFEPLGADQALPQGKLLVFKKAAVARGKAHKGLGTAMYELAEAYAREQGYAGMVLETVREADWLYDWYVRLGFRPIGRHRYPGGQVDTILLVKPFEDRP